MNVLMNVLVNVFDPGSSTFTSTGTTTTTNGLVRTVGGAEVDWSAGTVTAWAGAAADIRMPSPEVARPGAERRARAAARVKLRAALGELPVGAGRKLEPAAIETALGRARSVAIEYQSNGGVMLALGLSFADLVEARASEVTLVVSAMSPKLSPAVVLGEREGALGSAVYRLGGPPAGTKALVVKCDNRGRLELGTGDVTAFEKLAGARAVIYVEKVLR